MADLQTVIIVGIAGIAGLLFLKKIKFSTFIPTNVGNVLSNKANLQKKCQNGDTKACKELFEQYDQQTQPDTPTW